MSFVTLTRKRWSLVVALVGAAFLIVATQVLVASRLDVSQPVEFNHAKHTEELGLACEFCHVYVRNGAHAGLPDAQQCGMCHRTRLGTSEEAHRVTELLEAGDDLRFMKLFNLPDHVFYTHRRHAGIGEIECENCHGAIAQTDAPPPRALINITMEFCLECHQEMGQTEDCNACHR